MKSIQRRGFRWCGLVCILAVLLAVSGCGGGSNGDGTPAAKAVPEEPPTVTADSNDLAIVLSPEVAGNTTTAEQDFAVSGTVLSLQAAGLPAAVSWALESGGVTVENGEFLLDGQGAWGGTVRLEPGDNVLILSIKDTPVTVSVRASCNPGYAFGSELVLDPDVAYIGEPRQVTATITLTDETTDPEKVSLVRIDGTETVVAQLKDDGACATGSCAATASGDEIGGDFVYTGRFTVNEPQPQDSSWRVVVERLDDAGAVRSEIMPVLVTTHLSDAEFDHIRTIQQTFQQQLDDAVAAGTVAATMDQVVAALEADPQVAQVVRNSDNRGIGVIYESGVGGVLSVHYPGTKAGARPEVSLLPAPVPLWAAVTPPAVRAAETEKIVVGSRNVKVIASQYHDWGFDDVVQMKKLFEQTCFDVEHHYVTTPGKGSVEYFKNLSQYGVILISTHGNTFYEGVKSLWIDVWGSNSSSAIVVLDSNMEITAAARKTYEDELKTQRLLIYDKGFHFGVTPAFIHKYSTGFHNSLVYLGACRSVWNTSLANVFLRKGAGAVLGYTNYVGNNFCIKESPPVIEKLLADPENTLAEAFTPGRIESGDDAAEFKLLGDKRLSLGVSGLVDGSFEYSLKSPAWKIREGDFRILHTFGGSKATDPPPPAGQVQSGNVHLALISTGLGKTQTSGVVYQKICLPEKAVSLSFDWNFYSEEFKEYCDTLYDDTFRVYFRDPASGTEHPLFQTSVNQLCANKDALLPQPFYLNMGKGDAWYTGWRKNQQVNITAYKQGKPLELVFAVSDVGDSIYDTAVLLDNVRLIEEDAP